ncbi:DUF59 domain-containing protein [Candidatus Woesearchaeota archaeon]|nr:DUF59 domain-containing protein [Candidatus Woesearchaeota archaeon]
MAFRLSADAVRNALRDVADPEMRVNIIDLGLVYGVKIDKGIVGIEMTLTSPACPVGPLILEAVEGCVMKLPGVKKVSIDIVWEPPWSIDKVSEEARLELGI